MLLPHLAGVVVETVQGAGSGLRIVARARVREVACPRCGVASGVVHGRYRRRLRDAAVGGRDVVIDLLVRRMRCAQTGCATVTFAEQFPGLSSPHARYTPLAEAITEAIGLALAGRPGARLARTLGLPLGRDTLLRRVRALDDPPVPVVQVLGVDDFALRRSHDYGTVLIDLDSHRPVDLLPGRAAAPFAAWLTAHPGTTVICRDRAGAYATGASTGAPTAIQVADRYHLWANLGEAVRKCVTTHRDSLILPPPTATTGDAADPQDDDQVPDIASREIRSGASQPQDPPTSALDVPDKLIIIRTRRRYADVNQLLAEGVSRNQVARILGLDIQTVRRFANATSVEEVLTASTERASKIDRFKEHLHRRWNEGITDASALTEEIQSLGYTGSAQTVRRYVRRFRHGQPAPAEGPIAPTVRRTSRWLMTRPDRHDPDDRATLAAILEACPALARLADHVTGFATMMTQLKGQRLPDWITAVEADNLPALTSFASHLRHDLAAVTNGLTLPYSSGAVEGTVNKIKNFKRAMYGRANFDLLRKRVLLAT